MTKNELLARLDIILELSRDPKAAGVMLDVLVEFADDDEVLEKVGFITEKFTFRKKVK